MALLAPSILSADFGRIAEAVQLAEEAGADLIHVDIMDGHFVPNLTFGPQLVSAVKKITQLPLDVHLMVDNPETITPLFCDAGADWISIHVEATDHLHKDISFLKEKDVMAGLALNPGTPLHLAEYVMAELDYILVMSVNPGWGGQGFIPASRSKISRLKSWIDERNLSIKIEIDGGVDLGNMADLLEDGTDIFVAGSAIYKSSDPRETIRKMKEILSGTIPL